MKKLSSFCLVTGATGFIGRRVVAELLANRQQPLLLVRKQSLRTANLLFPDLPIIEADITKKLPEIKQKIHTIYHIAALYDVKANKKALYAANLKGTENMLNLALNIRGLNSFVYLSTAYVAGMTSGKILESELSRPKSFRNDYEKSKFEAEKLVKSYMVSLPIIIFRPSIVVGDSKTGQTDKFDGAYKLIDLIRLRMFKMMPGKGELPFHIVPVDFVAKAIVKISGLPTSTGQTFHLSDPKPLTVAEFINQCARLLNVPPPKSTIPGSILTFVSLISPKLRSRISFFTISMNFDMSNTNQALKKLKINPPVSKIYLPNIIKYYKLKH